MSTNPNAPLANQPGGLWIQRAVGVGALLAGLALGGLFVTGMFKLVSLPSTGEAFALTFLAVIGVLTAFFVNVGWRMALNRPNRHGSLLTPGLWFSVAVLFVIFALTIASYAVTERRFANLETTFGALAFAVLATLAGWRARKKRNAGGDLTQGS